MGHTCAMWKVYSETYGNNVKCIYTNVCGHIVDCSEFILGICTDIGVSYMHMNYLPYVTFEGHICFWYTYGNIMEIKFIICVVFTYM